MNELPKPWWAGSLITVAMVLGPTTLAFFLLLAVLFGWSPSGLDAKLDTNMNRLIHMERELSIHTQLMIEYHKRSLGLQWGTCLNTATTDAEAARCERFWTK